MDAYMFALIMIPLTLVGACIAVTLVAGAAVWLYESILDEMY